MKYRQYFKLLCLTLLIVVFSACSKTPKTADGAAKKVIEGFKDNHAEVIWEALPNAYQKDINTLIHDFSAKMDEELYEKSFSIAQQIVDVLRNKKAFILNSPLMSQAKAKEKKAAIDKNWATIVDLLAIITDSEIAHLSKVKKIDMGHFLDNTGSKILKHINTLSDLVPKNKSTKSIHKIKAVKLLSSEENHAEIQIIYDDDSVNLIKMTKKDDKWLPTDLVKDWDKEIDRVKKAIHDLTPEKISQRKVRILMVIGSLEALIGQLQKADSQDEFNQAVGGLMMGMMGFRQ